ncbi:hypothetical protein ISF62_18335 [Burkholderia pseudomallei]|nr:hypothetical protein [Burkholderia pseudomallei]MBF3820805.1 hypothetical protein [Burkholderia pseudomallei]
MPKFNVDIVEMLTHRVRVEADDEEQARARAVELVKQTDAPFMYLSEPRALRPFYCERIDEA